MTWEQTAPAAEERTIAGHRVLRLLARGERSRVWLAADERVLKVLATPWAPNQPMAEVEALHRARGDHVIELLDVAIDETQAVLVFPRLARGSLADVLMSRSGFDAGEAVTALAPLAVTLARMHGAGVSHGSVSASNVLFRVDAAPMLIGFGGASLFESGLPEVRRERVPGVIADRAALASLAEAVLGRVTGPRSAAAAALAATLSPGSSQLDLEARLARELFELAAARPIALERPQGDAGIPRAVGVIALPAPSSTALARSERAPEPHARRAEWGVLTRLSRALEHGPGSILRARVAELWSSWPPTRRKVAVAVGAGLLVLLVAVAVIPSPTDQVAPAAAATADPLAPTPPTDESTLAVTGDDPLVAVAALLQLRERCFRDLSVLCLDDVDEQGSSALDADRAALDGVRDDGVVPAAMSAAEATILERLGDSVLIQLGPNSDPASVLLLKGEAGWRIRDYVANG